MHSASARTGAKQDIPPATRRFVHHRDRETCVVPGCRAARNLDVHHIVHRADGGDHSPENLVLLCGLHHRELHKGRITITGRAPAIEVHRTTHVSRELRVKGYSLSPSVRGR